MKRFLLPVYAYSLLNELVFIYSLCAVMFNDYGLDASRISVLFAVWSVTAFVLEVPSGALADRYSRKHVLLVGQISKLACFACWLLIPTFTGFLIGFMFWGVQSAFRSGTLQALVFDELKHFGMEGDYAKVIGRTRALSTAGLLLADLGAVLMAPLGYGPILMASLVSLTASCAAIVCIRPVERVESTRGSGYVGVLSEGLREALSHRSVLRLIVFLSFAVVFYGTLDEYWPLLYRSVGISLRGIVVLGALATAVQAVAGLVVHRFSRLPERTLLVSYPASGLLLALAAYLMRPISVLCVPVLCFVWVILDVTFESRLQQEIRASARATVLSVRGFMDEVMALVLVLGFGWVAHLRGYRGGFLGAAGVMVLIGIVYLCLNRSASGEPDASEPASEVTVGR